MGHRGLWHLEWHVLVCAWGEGEEACVCIWEGVGM